MTPPKRKRVAIKVAKRSTVLRLSHDRKWTTPDEVAFIAALGTHTPDRHRAPRAELLQRYREAMALRQDWGDIDEVRVAHYRVRGAERGRRLMENFTCHVGGHAMYRPKGQQFVIVECLPGRAGATIYRCMPCQVIVEPWEALGHLQARHGIATIDGNRLLLHALLERKRRVRMEEA